MNTIYIGFSFLALVFGIGGYIYKIPVVSILAYTSAIIFMCNSIVSGFALKLPDCRDVVKRNSNDDVHNLPYISLARNAAVLSYAGIPLTLGFWAWLFLLAGLYFGVHALSLEFRLIAYIFTVFVFVFYVVQLCGITVLYRKHFCGKSEENFGFRFDISTVLAGVILAVGLFPQKFLKLIYVPVSFLTGGTKYYQDFQAITSCVNSISIYLLIFVVLISLYVIVKFAISRLKNNTPKV